jgi:hypothetical protein
LTTGDFAVSPCFQVCTEALLNVRTSLFGGRSEIRVIEIGTTRIQKRGRLQGDSFVVFGVDK